MVAFVNMCSDMSAKSSTLAMVCKEYRRGEERKEGKERKERKESLQHGESKGKAWSSANTELVFVI